MMRGQEQRHTFGGELGERDVDAVAALGIDADRRLVEQNDARMMEDAARDVQPSAHATRELFHGFRGAIGQAGAFERPVHLLRQFRPSSPCRRPKPSRFSRAVSSG